MEKFMDRNTWKFIAGCLFTPGLLIVFQQLLWGTQSAAELLGFGTLMADRFHRQVGRVEPRDVLGIRTGNDDLPRYHLRSIPRQMNMARYEETTPETMVSDGYEPVNTKVLVLPVSWGAIAAGRSEF